MTFEFNDAILATALAFTPLAPTTTAVGSTFADAELTDVVHVRLPDGNAVRVVRETTGHVKRASAAYAVGVQEDTGRTIFVIHTLFAFKEMSQESVVMPPLWRPLFAKENNPKKVLEVVSNLKNFNFAITPDDPYSQDKSALATCIATEALIRGDLPIKIYYACALINICGPTFAEPTLDALCAPFKPTKSCVEECVELEPTLASNVGDDTLLDAIDFTLDNVEMGVERMDIGDTDVTGIIESIKLLTTPTLCDRVVDGASFFTTTFISALLHENVATKHPRWDELVDRVKAHGCDADTRTLLALMSKEVDSPALNEFVANCHLA